MRKIALHPVYIYTLGRPIKDNATGEKMLAYSQVPRSTPRSERNDRARINKG